MLFSGASFCLSQKLSLRDAGQLRDLIRGAGGKVLPNALDPNTIIVVDSFDLVRDKSEANCNVQFRVIFLTRICAH